MANIKIITDSASDIPAREAAAAGLSVLQFPLSIGGQPLVYLEDYRDPSDFYRILEQSKELPKTSQIPPQIYLDEYRRLHREGADTLLVVTLSATASATIQSATMAREQFFKEDPTLQERVQIEILDSKTFSVAYGYPCLMAAKRAAAGESLPELLAFLNNWFSRVEIYVAAYSLEYAKRSGRVGSATAIMGTALGMRPIISVIGGKIKTHCTVRGSAAVGDKLFEIAKARIGKDCIYGMLKGTLPEPPVLLERRMTALCSASPFGVYFAGSAITSNIGPRMLGIGVLIDP